MCVVGGSGVGNSVEGLEGFFGSSRYVLICGLKFFWC